MARIRVEITGRMSESQATLLEDLVRSALEVEASMRTEAGDSSLQLVFPTVRIGVSEDRPAMIVDESGTRRDVKDYLNTRVVPFQPRRSSVDLTGSAGLFEIRLCQPSDDLLRTTIEHLGLTKLDDPDSMLGVYELANGKRLSLGHDDKGYVFQPRE
jgi:hypothetical protein